MQPVYAHIIKLSQNHLFHVIRILEELQLEKPDGFEVLNEHFQYLRFHLLFWLNYNLKESDICNILSFVGILS